MRAALLVLLPLLFCACDGIRRGFAIDVKTGEEFNTTILQSEKPVFLVLYSTQNCGMLCDSMWNIFDFTSELAEEREATEGVYVYAFVYWDLVKPESLVNQFNIRALPAPILAKVRNGKIVYYKNFPAEERIDLNTMLDFITENAAEYKAA